MDRVARTTAEVLRRGADRLGLVSACRVSCEGWLKVELLNALDDSDWVDDQAGIEVIPELDRVDLTIRLPTYRLLIELKTFPTNYPGASGKPITQFVNSVVSDLRKLASRRRDLDVGLAIWLAYPIPEPEPAAWKRHIEKISAEAARVVLSQHVEVGFDIHAGLYVMESR